MTGFFGWNLSITQAQELIPYIVQFGRFYSGEITLGQLSPDGRSVPRDLDRPVVLP